MKKSILKRFFELSRLMPQIPETKQHNLYLEVMQNLKTSNLNVVKIDDEEELTASENKNLSNFLNFMDKKIRITKMVHFISDNKEIEDELEESFNKDKQMNSLNLVDLLRPAQAATGKPDVEEAKDSFKNNYQSNKDDEKYKPKIKQEEFEEVKEIVSGKYYMENGKMIKGSPEGRNNSSYSNWTAGNVDPQDLERHKQLLERQHFGGPFWEGKEKPKSITQEMPNYIPGVTEEDDPVNYNSENAGEQSFKKIRSN